MNLHSNKSSRCSARARYCLSIAVAILIGGATAVGPGNAAQDDAKSQAIAGATRMLREAGATSSVLDRFNEEAQAQSPEQIQGTLDELNGMSQEARTRLVRDMEYDLQYVLSADSKPRPGVPNGETFEFTLAHSTLFPGASRTISVYVPSQYTGDRPACVYVQLDSLLFEVSTVFDNLIYKHEMPVTIAIGISSGTVESAQAPEDPRFDRSFEFDTLNDRFGRFVLQEVLPAVEQQKAPGGRSILLSRDPNDRAVGGGSTGGIGAFTLAWEHPDAFRRVFTAVGTFVGMRGGDRYPVLIRKTEPKPIRIYMQDGSHDGLDDFIGEVGDWWMSNQTVERALAFAGYEVEHVWGEGGHSARQSTVVFPDALRWLWKDWPQSVRAGEPNNVFLKAILQRGEGWQTVIQGEGDVLESLRATRLHHASGPRGRDYFAEEKTGQLWLERPRAPKVLLDSGLNAPTGVALSPDGLWLAVAEKKSHWGYSYKVRSDGTVAAKRQFYWFHVPDTADDSGATGWVFDRDGRLYASTRMGIQVFDRNGRSRAILPLPDNNAAVAVAFGGTDLSSLYVVSADKKIYRRKLRVAGARADATPVRLPAGSAG